MNKIPEHIVEEIFQTARIEEVIGDFVQLKKSGSNLKGLSPFNDEKTPSFVVSPSKQIFKCFSSGKGGTVVTFLMEMEHFSYPEALKWLADKYGIVMPEQRELSAEELAYKNERDSLFIINEFACQYFKEKLSNSKEGKSIGMTYFKERGYIDETIEKFELGYSINSFNDFLHAATEKGFKKDLLVKLGLVKESNGKSFDFFKGRVIFPIHSVTGRILGFGARMLGSDKKIAKYFNSPESLIYNKSKILYGLYFAKSEILKNDECYLCEGYTDVLSLYQAGIKNIVSSSGTSLTKEQIRLISRYTQNITILFDGDAAGIRASFRGIDLILEEGMSVNVVQFPLGEDPDSYAKKSNLDEIQEFISNHKKDFISFKSSILFEDGKINPIDKTKLIKELINSISLIPDSISRSVYIKEIANQFEIKESILVQEVFKIRGNLKSSPVQNSLNQQPVKTFSSNTKVEKINEDFIHEKELIRLMLRYGKDEISFNDEKSEIIKTSIIELVIDELEIDELEFKHNIYSEIYTIFKTGIEQKTLYSIDYFKSLENQEIVKVVTELEDLNADLSHNWVHKYNIYTKVESDNLYETTMNVIYFFKLNIIQGRLNEVTKLLQKDSINNQDTLLLLSEQVAYENIKKELTSKLGRTILK